MTAPIKTVGYIGLGIMGRSMAANLLKGGFDVTVWNRTASRAQSLVDEGAQRAESPADLAARKPDCICLNVTDTPDVEAVLFGDQGLARTAAPGLIVIDHSTISPSATRQFAKRLAKQNVTLLDAPVSGGDVGARNATLSIMVGGDADAFSRCLPVLQAMGRSITHLGDSGAGQTCKACNQICVAGALQAVCEAINLARASKLDVRKMIEVVAAGAGGSWQLANLGPKIAQSDFAPGFMIDLVLKDLKIIAEAAAEHSLALDSALLAQQRFQRVAEQGGGRLGTQAIIQAIENN